MFEPSFDTVAWYLSTSEHAAANSCQAIGDTSEHFAAFSKQNIVVR
jgi:hypothetical protein